MSDESKVTARPWEMTVFVDNRPHGSSHHTYRVTPQRGVYGTLFEQDAALIVRAVNRDHAFDAMKEALEEVRWRLGAAKQTNWLNSQWHPVLERVDAALRLASGEEQ